MEVAESVDEPLTMAAVSARLGVAQPALYYHVRNMDELLTLVAAALLDEIELPDLRMRWDRWLAEFSLRLRQLLIDQPVLTRLPYLAVHPPFSAEALEGSLTVLTRAGFAPDYALVMFSQHVRVVVDLVHAEHAREHERQAGRSQIGFLRTIMANRTESASTPILDAIADRFAGLPDDVEGYDDLLFDWQINIEIAGWRAVLDNQVPTQLLGTPLPLPE